MFDKIGFFIEVCYNICVENKEWGNYNIMEDLKVNLYVTAMHCYWELKLELTQDPDWLQSRFDI